jgi:hypothetical protein
MSSARSHVRGQRVTECGRPAVCRCQGAPSLPAEQSVRGGGGPSFPAWSRHRCGTGNSHCHVDWPSPRETFPCRGVRYQDALKPQQASSRILIGGERRRNAAYPVAVSISRRQLAAFAYAVLTTCRARSSRLRRRRCRLAHRLPRAQAVEVEVHHRGRVERQELAHDQASDDGDAQGAAELAADAGA